MSKVIKFKISGSGTGTDAPTADDLLDQLRDYLEILRGVEEALAEDGQNAIEWRVINASKNTPITHEIQAFSKQYGVDVTRRVNAVVLHTATGLDELRQKPERPRFFTDKVLARAEKTFERVTNGLDLSEIDFGIGLPALIITPAVARSAAKNANLALRPMDRPYKELGALEGYFQSAERDGHGRRLLWMKHRLDGESVKCVLGGNALTLVSQHTIDEVFRSRRLLVIGTIHYKSLGRISYIDATDVRFFAPRSDLPALNDILDENFTGGLTTEEYLEKLRNGPVS